MRLITFLPAATHQAPPRWHALGNAMAIKPKVGPKDGYPHNAFLLKSLGQALHDTGSMALVRCVLVCLPPSLWCVVCTLTQAYKFTTLVFRDMGPHNTAPFPFPIKSLPPVNLPTPSP